MRLNYIWKRSILITFMILFSLNFIFAVTSATEHERKVGVRGGLGTDVSLGIALGGSLNYLFIQNLEVGLVVFGGTYKETSTSYGHTYNETTRLLVIGVLANYLHFYEPEKIGVYLVTGFGLASISGNWQESSKTDTSLGTAMPGGGSTHNIDFGVGGPVANLGLGINFGKGLDIRLEVPIIYGSISGTTMVIPTFIATLGYRF